LGGIVNIDRIRKDATVGGGTPLESSHWLENWLCWTPPCLSIPICRYNE